jgi:hypothetical protein
MRAWRGWTVTSASAINTAPTWEAWCAWQQRLLRREQLRHVCPYDSRPFSDRELARLSFVRWLYQRGHLDPRDPPRNDNV